MAEDLLNTQNRRKLIAICGQPHHGKTTVQKILELFCDVEPFDDGRPIREATLKRYPELTWEDVTTAEGKSKIISINGQDFTVRQLLGNLGKEYESGDMAHWGHVAAELALASPSTNPASFGSVRRTQGHAYRSRGGIVLEVFDPRKPVSANDFDQYDPTAITHRIINDGDRVRLARRVLDAVQGYLAA